MKKIKWIMLAMVLCLGLVGGAYAAWSQTLEIDGTVKTANFKHTWENFTVVSVTNDPYGQVVVTPDYTSTPGKIIITITNVYPGYKYVFSADIHNHSSIRTVLDSVTLTSSNPSRAILRHVDGLAEDTIFVVGKSFKGTFEIEVLDGAVQGGETYSFSLDAVMVQE